jgi:hypothetical protein
MRYFPIIFLFVTVTIFSSCKDQAPEVYDCTGVTPTYTTNVKPILDAKCATSGCHNSATKKEGYDFSNYASASSGSKNEAFLGSIQHKRGFEEMPHDAPKLDENSVKILSCWVQNGSPE